MIRTKHSCSQPCNEANLVAQALTRLLKFKVKDGETAVTLGEVRNKVVVFGMLSRLVHHDAQHIVREFVDNIFKFFLQL